MQSQKMEPRLTDSDREILKFVVRRWMNMSQSTARRSLVLKFKDPERLDDLVRATFFRVAESEVYRPTFLAVEFSGDSDLLQVAKRSTAVALRVLRNLYETELEETTFSYEEIEALAKRTYDTLEPRTLQLGLYFSQELRIFSGNTANQSGAITSVGLTERIISIAEPDLIWDEEVQRRITPQKGPVRTIPAFANTTEPSVTFPFDQRANLSREDARRTRLREILDGLSKLQLCGPSDDPDEQTGVTESYKYLLTHVKRLSRNVVSVEVRRELDALSTDSIESIYDVYDSKAHLDAIAVDIAYELDNPIKIVHTNSRDIISASLLDQLGRAKHTSFDTKKLLGYCIEINSSFANENIVACLLLMRTVLNHIPPIFGHSTFAQVTAGAARSVRESFEHLEAGLRKLADLHAHQPIRKREQYPTLSQIEPFIPHFELLLQEVLNNLE